MMGSDHVATALPAEEAYFEIPAFAWQCQYNSGAVPFPLALLCAWRHYSFPHTCVVALNLHSGTTWLSPPTCHWHYTLCQAEKGPPPAGCCRSRNGHMFHQKPLHGTAINRLQMSTAAARL